MSKYFVFLLLAGLLFGTVMQAGPSKTHEGRVASFNDLVIGGSGDVTKDKAEELYKKGQPIVFVTGQGKSAKVYFVFNESGTYMGKRLAKYADSKIVKVTGKTKKVNGVNIIIASKVEAG
ncbi:hypothetical protein ACFLSQ_04305 [Bacteroidota bacterium]